MGDQSHRLLDLTRQTMLPGGGVALEGWPSRSHVVVQLIGEFDAFDVNAIVDLFASFTLERARFIEIDARQVGFIDLRSMYALDRVRRFLDSTGGELVMTGMYGFANSIWDQLSGAESVVATTKEPDRQLAVAS